VLAPGERVKTDCTSSETLHRRQFLPLPELPARVAREERIIISRYNTPMAELVPPPQRRNGATQGYPSAAKAEFILKQLWTA